MKNYVNSETMLIGDYATGYTYLGVATTTKFKLVTDSNYETFRVQNYSNKTIYVILEATNDNNN